MGDPVQRTHHHRGPTILNWLKRYREGGEKIEALFPSDRSDCGRARSISDETFAALLQIRKEKPSFTIKKVVEEAYRRNIITKAERVALPTVYRHFRLHDQKTEKKQEDMRRFEVELSNDMWQADALHAVRVSHGGTLRKSYLLTIIDDKSRLIVGSGFYLSESADSFIDCLSQALKSRGYPGSCMSTMAACSGITALPWGAHHCRYLFAMQQHTGQLGAVRSSVSTGR